MKTILALLLIPGVCLAQSTPPLFLEEKPAPSVAEQRNALIAQRNALIAERNAIIKDAYVYQNQNAPTYLGPSYGNRDADFAQRTMEGVIDNYNMKQREYRLGR